MKGKIHSFQSFGTVDGPGIRFVVFMHGCNLSCGYCHNIDVCRGEFQEYEPEEVLDKVLRYKEYFGNEGGITVSGGEPLLQAEFVTELFELCKKNGISTCLDTSGSVFNESCKKLLDYTDIVLLDIKMTNDEDYHKHIGCSMSAPLSFLDRLEEKNIKTVIRHVVVGGLNDTEEDISGLKKLISDKRCIVKTELLPFRKICAEKYESMKIPFPFEAYSEPGEDRIRQLSSIL